MKKIRLLVMLGVISTAAFAQQTIFTIKGNINWRNNRYVYLSYLDKNGRFKTDRSTIFNQFFAFKGEINEPGDMKLEITEDDYKNFKLRGCKMQDEATQLAKLKISINSELKPCQVDGLIYL